MNFLTDANFADQEDRFTPHAQAFVEYLRESRVFTRDPIANGCIAQGGILMMSKLFDTLEQQAGPWSGPKAPFDALVNFAVEIKRPDLSPDLRGGGGLPGIGADSQEG